MSSIVLVVEDDVELQLDLIEALESFGHRAMSAFNGFEALDLLNKTSELPSLIVLDWRMPMMDGAQTLAALKSDDRLAKIPVVVISGCCKGRVPYADVV